MNERISLSSVNIEVLLKLKQGRDEVKPEAVVTEYSDALVIPEAIGKAKKNIFFLFSNLST